MQKFDAIKPTTKLEDNLRAFEQQYPNSKEAALSSELDKFEKSAAFKGFSQSAFDKFEDKSPKEVTSKDYDPYEKATRTLQADLAVNSKEHDRYSSLYLNYIRLLEKELAQFDQTKVFNSKDQNDLVTELQMQQTNLEKELSLRDQRHKQKLHSLKDDLNESFKQSLHQSELHLDRIRKLETALNRFEQSLGHKDMQLAWQADKFKELARNEEQYKKKLVILQKDLELAHTQSSHNAELHVETIRKLQRELAKVNKHTRSSISSIGVQGVNIAHGEGDLSANIGDFYGIKKGSQSSKPAKHQFGPRDHDISDQRLVAKIRDIYADAFDTFDLHKQKNALNKALSPEFNNSQPVPSETSAVDSALGEHEKKSENASAYTFAEDALASELKAKHQKDLVTPATGRYASPTGFVNYDPVDGMEESENTGKPIDHGDSKEIQYPRVTKQEPVFSGTLPPPPVPSFRGPSKSDDMGAFSGNEMNGSSKRKDRHEERNNRHGSEANAFKWAAFGALVASGSAYAIGTIAETLRNDDPTATSSF